jgi:hypothetical protein
MRTTTRRTAAAAALAAGALGLGALPAGAATEPPEPGSWKHGTINAGSAGRVDFTGAGARVTGEAWNLVPRVYNVRVTVEASSAAGVERTIVHVPSGRQSFILLAKGGGDAAPVTSVRVTTCTGLWMPCSVTTIPRPS